MKNNFKDAIHQAVNNANLTGALGTFSEAYKINRAKAYEGIDFEELRGRIAELKAYAASNLDLLAAQFAEIAEGRAGVVVDQDVRFLAGGEQCLLALPGRDIGGDRVSAHFIHRV